MFVWINGERHQLTHGACVLDALEVLGVPRSGVAVAVDGAVVPRADWLRYALAEDERVEVLTAVQGG